MGLKYASVRQPHVVVMAPALTETGQPQGFPIKSGTSPVSLITFNENAEGAFKCDIKCLKQISRLTETLGMNGDAENLAELQPVPSCTSLVSDKLINKDNLNLKNCEHSDQALAKESDYSLLQIGGFMMSSSYSATGDEGNMGYQKSGSQANSLDSCNFLKMDLFKSLNTNVIPQGDLGGGGDLGHNVDEIMQVIKNMESKGNDIEENLDSSLQISDTNDIAGSLSTFEREILNEVVMMNMCVDENLGEHSLATEGKNLVIKDKVSETQNRQFKIERKCEWLLRRLRKLQAKAMGKHTSKEVAGLLQHISNMLEDCQSSAKSSPLYSALTSGKEDVLKTPQVIRQNSNLTNLVKRVDQLSQQQALALSQHHVSSKYFGSGAVDNAYFAANRQNHSAATLTALPKLSEEVCKEVSELSGQIQLEFKVVGNGIDSDATASSSGGESCDEMQHFNNPHQQNMAILKRASWRWGQDRAAVGSRWSWLQAQISDLEYRIRQTNELQKQIRTGKGGVNLAGDDPPRLCDSSVVVNGYHGALPGSTGKSVDDDLVSESACRTRPLMRNQFRKRKLFQTAGLHLTSKKAAKPITIPCGCRPPLTNCVLCTGRPQPTQVFEEVDLLTVNERISLLDPAFHPVLSFPNEVSQSIHFDAVIKTADWQLKCHRLQLKTPTLLRVLEQSEESKLPQSGEAGSKTRLLGEHHKRRYLRRNPATAFTDKIKKKFTKGKRQKMVGDTNIFSLGRLKTRRRFSSHRVPGLAPQESKDAEQLMEEDDHSESTSSLVMVSGAVHPSPVPSPTPHCSKERGDAFRRKRENSYDIDNIVIPYSVAASTRVEKLQYKEILTPKWRVHPIEPLPKIETKNNNGLIRRPSQEDGDTEDLTEEMLVNRHERCEHEERKKFSTYLKLPNSLNRPRGHRRADSRAESSGGNTPDPMSPSAPDGGGSPITSPPATPQPVTTDRDLADDKYTRRRTVSSRCASPVEVCHDEVAPYELRTFPLTDETYEKMLKAMPPGHPFKASSSHHNYSHDSESESRPMSPASDSTESADTFVEDDPNDPEWTVDESSTERPPLKR